MRKTFLIGLTAAISLGGAALAQTLPAGPSVPFPADTLIAARQAGFDLQLSGHTHGGQVRLLGFSPMVPSRFGNRYALGHVREEGRELIVSGGLGTSILPVRLGVPPEITVVELG